MQHLVFLSHSGSDTAAAIKLTRQIESVSGDDAFDVWLDVERDLKPGSTTWRAQIEDAIAQSTALPMQAVEKV